MGIAKIRERVTALQRRCGDLKPIAPVVREILVRGNRENKLKGIDQQGFKYAPLAASTLERRPRPGNVPFVTKGVESAVIAGIEILVSAGISRLSFTVSFPTITWEDAHGRKIGGFRAQDLESIRIEMSDYVMDKKGWRR